MNEVSKYAEISCSPFDNLHVPLDDVNIEIWVLEATVRKHLLNSLVHFLCQFAILIRRVFYKAKLIRCGCG